MKPLNYKAIVSASICLIIFPTFALAQVSDSLSFNMSQFSFGSRNSYNVIEAKGFQNLSKIACPQLPVRIVALAVPPATAVQSITINKEVNESMTGVYHIYPAQPPIVFPPENSRQTSGPPPFMSPNSTVYESSSPYPSNAITVISTGYFDGTRIVWLRVSPFKYIPSSGKLDLMTEISFTVNLKPSSPKPIPVFRRSLQAQNDYDEMLRSVVDNPQDISKYQQRPDVLFSATPSGINVGYGEQKTFSTSSVTYARYMIITSSSLAPDFQAFINQKQADGMDISLVTTDWIYANFDGDQISNPPIYDDAGSIREFLLSAYQQGCEYVLLGGNQTAVPVRYATKTVTAYQNGQLVTITQYIPTDLYYSDMVNNWNPEDWDASPNVDLFVGRLPFDNSQDIENWTDKLVQYEKDPFPWNPQAVTKVLWNESDEIEDNDGGAYGIASPDFPSTFTQTLIQEEPSGGSASPTSPTGAQIISTLNQGYGFGNMDDHGSPDHVAVRTAYYNDYPKYGVFALSSLQQYSDYPDVAPPDTYAVETGNGFDNSINNGSICYSIGCTVAEYDSASEVDGVSSGDECMAQAWLSVNGGGPAFIGDTRDGLFPDGSELESYFAQDLYSSEDTIGKAQMLSKLSYRDDWEEYTNNLFGDPSMKVWKTAPSNHITAGTWHITTLNNVIPAGVTIYVDPGATIEFDPGANLTVEGTIIADGTASQPITFTSTGSTSPGSWGSIIFSGSGANNSTLQYCNIRYGTTIQANNTSNVTIENCNIMNSSSYGIDLSSSSNFLAQSDTIANSNIYDGILIFGGSNNNCYENAVFKYQGGQGIGIVYSASGGNVGGNDVYSYGWGISAMYGSSLTSYDPYYAGGYNRIADCLENLVVYQNSYADFGEYDVDYDGQNSIYGNANLIYNADIGYEYPSVPAGVYAYYDWWGSNPPDASLFNVGSACYFYYDSWLGSDPWGNVPLPSAHQVTGGGARIAYAASKANNKGVDVKSSANSVALQDSILIGIRLREQNKFSEAMNYFLSYVGKHPEDPAGYVELYGCTNDTTLPDILNFFKTPSAKAPAIEEFLLGNLYQMENQPDLAVQVNNNIITDYPNNPLAVKAETSNMLIDLYDKNDLKGAESLLAAIKAQANLISPMELQDAEEAVALYSGRPAAGAQASSQSSESTSASTTPKSFGLAQNYPNPFNPSTILRYEIPKAGRVEVTVYDILGRVVETLVDKYEQAGAHSVQFNGERLASGVYFYRLTAPGIMQVKKMLLLK